MFVFGLALDSSSQFQIVSGEMQRKITDLTELKSLYESTISKYENTIKDLLDKIEEAGDKTSFQRAMELVKETIDYSKTRLPQKEFIREENKQRNNRTCRKTCRVIRNKTGSNGALVENPCLQLGIQGKKTFMDSS